MRYHGAVPSSVAVLALIIAAAGCSSRSSHPEAEPIRLWHTFNEAETELLNQTLAERDGPPVEVTRIAFARGHVILSELLAGGDRCPDLLRIDVTWLAALAHRLAPVPAELADRSWLPEARELGTIGGAMWGAPQSLDGLVLIADARRAGGAWPPRDLAALIAAKPGIPIDAYWFVPFLRAARGDVLDPNSPSLEIAGDTAVAALERFARLTRGGPETNEGAARSLVAGRVPLIIEGPWAIGGLRDSGLEVAVAPFPVAGAAPRGGQLFVVPRCADRPDAAWALAADLTAPGVQRAWSRVLALVPTTETGLTAAEPVVRDLRTALQSARPLPAHPITPELFDDLSPAIEAVVAGDATAAEALAGVDRSWRRLAGRHGVELAPPAPEP
jgi:ABC-type glycerol-3-phosphate transport system substrate-binding protein